MTDEMERQAEAIFAHLDELGDGSMLEGVYAGIDNGWFVSEIADAAYRFERRSTPAGGSWSGVNAFTDGDDGGRADAPAIGADVEDRPAERRLADARAGPATTPAVDRARRRRARRRRPDAST